MDCLIRETWIMPENDAEPQSKRARIASLHKEILIVSSQTRDENIKLVREIASLNDRIGKLSTRVEENNSLVHRKLEQISLLLCDLLEAGTPVDDQQITSLVSANTENIPSVSFFVSKDENFTAAFGKVPRKPSAEKPSHSRVSTS